MSDPIISYEKEIMTGLFPTSGKRQSPFWRDGRNVAFVDMALTSLPGQFSMFDTGTGFSIIGVKATIQDLLQTVYFGTRFDLSKWSLEDGVTELTATPFTGTDEDTWSFARWGNWIVATNGVDPVMVDKNDSMGFVELQNTPFTWAKILYGTDTQLFAMNTSNDPGEICFCDIDDIETWAPLSSNQAGAKIQRNLASPITCAVALGSNIAAYTEFECIIISYIGTPFVYSILPAEKGVGATGKNAVVSVGQLNYGFGKTGIWLSDGTTVQHIDAPAIHKFVYGLGEFRVNKEKAHLAVAWHDLRQKAVTFFYPAGTDKVNSIGVTIFYNVDPKCWSILDFGRNCVDDTGIFDFAITGAKNGTILQQNVDGVPFQSGANNPGLVDLTNPEATVEWDGYGESGYGDGDFGGGLLIGAD